MLVIALERYLLPIWPVRTLGPVLVRCGLLALLALIAACGSSTPADSTASSSGSTPAVTAPSTGSTPAVTASTACGPAGATTLASDAVARVYESAGYVYGCARGATRQYRLGNAKTCVRSERAGPVALSGRIVAYGLAACGIDTGSSTVLVRRLSDGRQLRALPATTGPLAPESYQLVGSIVVKLDGAVAWIGQASSIVRHSVDVEVHRADSRGQAELDSGGSIGARSLRLHGSRLTWRHGTTTRSASLL